MPQVRVLAPHVEATLDPDRVGVGVSSPLPRSLVARMSWPVRRQLARRRHEELLTAAAEHYTRYPDSGDSRDLLFEHWTPINKPLQLPTNIERPALSVYRMLNDEASAASHVRALLNA